jgi:hypothetical protein
MNLDLRPLSIGELFDRAFTLYRRNLWLFVGVTAVPSVLALIMTLLLQTMQHPAWQTASPDQAEKVLAGVLWLTMSVVLVAGLYWVVYMVALGATTFAVSELYVGRPTTVSQAYGRMNGRIGGLVLLMLVIGSRLLLVLAGSGVLLVGIAGVFALVHPALSALAVALGFMGVFAVIVYMTLRYGVAVPALVLEGLKPTQAVKRSIALTRGRLGRVFLLVVCATMITYAGMALFQGPFAVGAMMAGPESARAFWLNVIGAITGTIGATFTAPFLIIGLALIYYDARIRQEGLDLELTLAALDRRPDAASV